MAPDLKSGAFWKLPQPDLFGKYFNGEPGGWVDKGKTQLRIAKPSIKIGDMSLGEMLVNWKDGAPQSMTVMMYNKGDNGAIGKDEFDKRLELIKESLTALTGIQPKEYRASRKEAAGPGFGTTGRLPWRSIHRGRAGSLKRNLSG